MCGWERVEHLQKCMVVYLRFSLPELTKSDDVVCVYLLPRKCVLGNGFEFVGCRGKRHHLTSLWFCFCLWPWTARQFGNFMIMHVCCRQRPERSKNLWFSIFLLPWTARTVDEKLANQKTFSTFDVVVIRSRERQQFCRTLDFVLICCHEQPENLKNNDLGVMSCNERL